MEQDDADRLPEIPLGSSPLDISTFWIGELLLYNDVHREVVAQKLEGSPGFSVNLLDLVGIYGSFLLSGLMVLLAQKTGLVIGLLEREDILSLGIEEVSL